MIYAAGTASRLYPTRRAVAVVAVLVGVVGLIFVISPVPMPWRLAALGPALLFTPVVGATSIFDAERNRANQRLLLADEEIARLATIAERERIARDLHDLLGHTLSVIVLKSEVAARLVRLDPSRAAAEVNDIGQISREALGEVRAAVAGYRARGLGAELDGARVALEAAGVDVEVHADPTDLSAEQESALAMALREAVTNVVRHAAAQRATVSITKVGADVRLEVSDDGRGSAGPAGSGITGMRERIAALGGSVTVGGRMGRDGRHGTVVEVTLPLAGTVNHHGRQTEGHGGR
jgi:two-component system sensor histidine kinase DesK